MVYLLYIYSSGGKKQNNNKNTQCQKERKKSKQARKKMPNANITFKETKICPVDMYYVIIKMENMKNIIQSYM